MEDEVQYIASFDSCGNNLDGDKNYILHLPPDIPVKDFWSVIVHDKLTRLMIRTDQVWPSVYSSCEKLLVNQDSSVEVYFGVRYPDDKKNWIKTIPGKSWYMILHLYGPMELWYNKTWRPGEIEEVK
jgi:hypothetical protein